MISRRRFLLFLALFGVVAYLAFAFMRVYVDFGLPRNLIVLVPDPDGRVGELDVSNQNGAVTLNKPYQATGASRSDEAPRAPFTVREDDVRSIFSAVAAQRPPLPVTVTLNFQPGVNIAQTAGVELDRIVGEIQARPNARVSIFGYASATGNAVINHAASLFRARAVGSALAARGLDSNDFLIESLIDTTLSGTVQAGDGIPNNRRVEVVIR